MAIKQSMSIEVISEPNNGLVRVLNANIGDGLVVFEIKVFTPAFKTNPDLLKKPVI